MGAPMQPAAPEPHQPRQVVPTQGRSGLNSSSFLAAGIFHPRWEQPQGSAMTYERPDGRHPMSRPSIGDSQDGPGFFESAKLGLMDDPASQIRALAERRFPDDPTAVRRYGQIDGEIVFVDEDGRLRREFSGAGSWGKTAGAVVPAMTGAFAGGVVAGPGGAAIGGMGGASGRKLGGLAQGERQSSLGNAIDLGIEGVLNLVGWKAGDALGKGTVNRMVARDLSKFDREGTDALIKMGEDLGIQLTAAEASNLGSLVSRQVRLGMGFDEAADVIRTFYKKRAGQVNQAVEREIGQSPGPVEAGAGAQRVMDSAINDAKASRLHESTPLYQASTNNPRNLLPEDAMARLEADPFMQKVLADVKGDPLYGLQDAPNNSLQVVDYVKQHLDDLIEQAERRGQNNRVRLLNERRKDLLATADKHFPDYTAARGKYAAMSPPVDELEQGLPGVISRLKDTSLQRASHIIMDPKSDPVRVANVRRLFERKGAHQEWQDVTRQYLRDVWETQSRDNIGDSTNLGANFRKKIFGTPRSRDVLKAALGPERYESFDKLMTVLEATGRAPRVQSMTEPAQQEARREAIEAAPMASAAGGFGMDLRKWWIDTKVGDWRKQLAEIVTNPESLKELEKLRMLRQMDPKSQAAVNLATAAVLKAGYGATADLLERDTTQLPEQLNPSPSRQ